MEGNQMDYMENERQNNSLNRNGSSLKITGLELNWSKFILFIITYLALQVGIVFVASIFVVILDMILGTNMMNYIDQIQYLSILDFIGFIIAMLIFRSVRDFLQGEYRLAALKEWQTYLYIVGAYFVVYFAQYLIFDVFQWEVSGSQVDLFGLNQIDLGLMNIFLLVIAFVVIAPVLEETLFRGLIFGFLSKKIGFIGALLASSIIFGLLHPGHQLSTTIMGMAFVIIYLKTKSLWTPILLHMIWNALATYGLLSLILAN
ncbi:lysostaphin resistance A-like protein [Amphibacillus sp. Q70]|uniref:CPBP family intramembrane glutamic endopeptidase n=1 Tax=Amphibacillus sp. Q70 TaxID=3453416 RepID=UPI003F84DDB3